MHTPKTIQPQHYGRGPRFCGNGGVLSVWFLCVSAGEQNQREPTGVQADSTDMIILVRLGSAIPSGLNSIESDSRANITASVSPPASLSISSPRMTRL